MSFLIPLILLVGTAYIVYFQYKEQEFKYEKKKARKKARKNKV